MLFVTFCLLQLAEYLHFALPTGLSVLPEFKHEVVSRLNLSLSDLSAQSLHQCLK